jgi:hypothetical protein
MLIECHTRRKKGTAVNFPGVSYHFKPTKEGGPHVCEVEDEGHIARLLSIIECYTEAGHELPKPVKPPSAPIVEIPDEPSDEDKLKLEEDLDIELQMCETIIGMDTRDACEQLGVLSDPALEQLATMEMSGQARATLLTAIEEERTLRTTDGGTGEDDGAGEGGDDGEGEGSENPPGDED